MESIELKAFKNLEHGENVSQASAIYGINNSVDYEVLSRNKELSYADYLNLSVAIRVLAEFFDVCSAVVVNEANICAVALGATVENAYEKVVDCNPIAILGACVGFSKTVSLDVAKLLNSMNVKNILAPDFSKEAFSYLLDKNINIIKINTPLHEVVGFAERDIKVTPFGALVQEQNRSILSKDAFNVVSQNKPTQEQAEDAIFAWKVAKHLRSKAVIVAKDLCTKALVQGEYNEVSAVEKAMDMACEYSKDAVLAIDGAITNLQTINTAIQGRIGLIIEAGDSKNSQEILKHADKYEISMIFTKIRNIKY